jgi:hypothetical protein
MVLPSSGASISRSRTLHDDACAESMLAWTLEDLASPAGACVAGFSPSHALHFSCRLGLMQAPSGHR